MPALRTTPLMVVAGLCAIAAIFCKRAQLLVGGFQLPNVDLPAVMTPFTVTNWREHGPGLRGDGLLARAAEFGIALGVVGLAFLVFFLGLKFLPLKPADQE